MAYLSIKKISLIEQGDIFKNLPIFPHFINDDEKIQIWNENISRIINNNLPSEPISFEIFPIPSMGILLNQDCDIEKTRYLVFAEIRKGKDKLNLKPLKSFKQKIKIIRDETRFHYLPPWNSGENENNPWVVDFLSIFLVPINLIKNNMDQYFVARLTPEFKIIFKDKISRFFTRLPFEDLIFLNSKERLAYKKDKKLSDEEYETRIKEINS